MVHPSDLLRSDSRSKEFAAPLHVKGEVENDWGISIFPCLAKLFNWRTFGKPSVFVCILSLIGCIQGLLLYYFRNTSDIWAKQYNITTDTADWLIYVNEFFIGLLALPITYWATITHRVVWISLLIICHGVISISLVISERLFAKSTPILNTTVQLCGTSNHRTSEGPDYGVFSILVIYQLFSAASSIAFYSIGLIYVHDNSTSNKSVVLAIALASRQLGQQLGIYASWIPNFFQQPAIFGSFIWQGVSILYILLGLGTAMFPKIMPSLLIKKLAASLLELASGISMNDISTPHSQGFLVAIRRILKNRIIIFSIISTVAIQTALINFRIFEKTFNQSRFFIADDFDENGFNNSFSLNLTTNLMDQPFSMLCILITGFVISRSRIKMKYLVLWNMITFSVTTLLFSSYLFIKCDYEQMTQLVPSCSVDCGCSIEDSFYPVCLHGRTYFSPCLAGCRNTEQIGDYKFYKNCSCAAFEGAATDGACHAEKCTKIYQLTQVNEVIARGLLATTVVTNIIIILGSVKRVDKSLALGLEMTLLSLVPFLPVKAGYEYVARKLCRYWYLGKCRLYSEQFSVFLSNATIISMILGTIAQIFLLSADLDNPLREKRIAIVDDISAEKNDSLQISSVDTNAQESQKFVRSEIVSEADSAYSKDNSLADLYSLGDDHDSDDDVRMDNLNVDISSSVEVLETHL